jgi:hypothetical protein
MLADRTAQQCWAEDATLIKPPQEVDMTIQCIQDKYNFLAAPLYAILAAIACKDIAHPTPALPLPASSAPPLPTLDGQTRQSANAPDLVVALDYITGLEHPVLPMRCLPPTLLKCRGGFLHQLQPCWHKQPHLVAWWCHHLRPPQQHHLLPPSYPLPLEMGYAFFWEDGEPIHSEHVALLFHCRSAHYPNSVLVVSANVMALELPTSRSLFYAGNVIGLAFPTNLLILDGLRRGAGGAEILFSTRIYLLCLFSSLGDSFLGCTLLLYVFPFSSFWLIVPWCIVLLLHPLPSVLLGLFAHLPFFFHFHLAMPYEIMGRYWYIKIDTQSTLGSLFSSIPPYQVVRDSGT